LITEKHSSPRLRSHIPHRRRRNEASQAGTRRQEPSRQTATTNNQTRLLFFSQMRQRTTSSPHMDSRRMRHAAGNHGGASSANDHVSKGSPGTDIYHLAIYGILEVTRHLIGMISHLPDLSVISFCTLPRRCTKSWRQCFPRCSVPKKLSVHFSNSPRTVQANTELLAKYDFDLEQIFHGTTFDYGSDFRLPTDSTV
jgi:hypothetical protein